MKLNASHPALHEARTIHTKYVVPADGSRRILKTVAANDKVGKGFALIRKGAWRGFPLFSVTLQERATCPSDCLRWSQCYGNGMAYAHRFQHGSEFEAQLVREIEEAAELYPFGFAVRLHILGDFYSVEYVTLWRNLLKRFPNLHVYGYSAQWQNPIAAAIQATRILYRDRFWLRFSRNFEHDGENIYAAEEGTKGVQCPEQTGKAQSCLDCGLCWAVNTTIIFQDHDKLNKQKKEKANENANG